MIRGFWLLRRELEYIKLPFFSLRVTRMIPYDSPANLFRVYRLEECDDDGYPFVWDTISLQRRHETGDHCSECGTAYRTDGDSLTVHHANANKADCRRENLVPKCWLHHKQYHVPAHGRNGLRCPHCKELFLGWPYLRRHIDGRHASLIARAG